MNKYLEKIAKDTGKLEEHQSRSVDKLLANKGVLLSHSTGSGKTRTILEAVKRIQERDRDGKHLIITPASLTTNIGKEHGKHKLKINMKNVEVISYEKALNNIDRLKKNKYSLVAMDEAHKLRNTDTKRFKHLEELIRGADHRLLATATPIYHSPENLSPLVNLVSGEEILPQDKKKFEERYISRKTSNPNIVSQFLLGKKPKETVNLTNKKELKEILNKHVDFYDAREDEKMQHKFPTQTEEIKEIPMSKEQERMYKYLENDIPFLIKMKIRNNLPLDKKESRQLNSFSMGVRQVSNSTRPYSNSDRRPELSPKILEAAKELEKSMKKDPNHRGLIYSNFLGAGLKDYSEHLAGKKIPHHVYHGGLTKKEKDQMVADYNAGKVPNLLVSSSGAEGLDLKGTKLVQVMEPHHNKSKIDQVTGRAARYESHTHLPKEEREVKVQHFHSKFAPGFFGKSKSKTIDQYLHSHSQNKNELVDKVKDLMRETK